MKLNGTRIHLIARIVMLATACGCARSDAIPALTREQAEVLRRATEDLIREAVPGLPRTEARAELTRALGDLSISLAVLPADSLDARIAQVSHLLARAATHPADSVHAAKIALLLERAHTLGQTQSHDVRRQP